MRCMSALGSSVSSMGSPTLMRLRPQVVYEEDWGLRQLAYPIQHKTTGFYYLIEFKADSQFVATLETQYHRDERIIRFLTVALDKDAVAYAEKRRANKAAKANAAEAPKTEEE